MTDSRDSHKPRIAIKLGASSLGDAKKPSRQPPASALGKRQRPHHALNNDSESDDDSRPRQQHERITAFGVNGATTEENQGKIRPADVAAPLVIQRQANRDWRSEARPRQREQPVLPKAAGERHGGSSQKKNKSENTETGIKWGLTVTKKRPVEADLGQAEEDRSRRLSATDEERLDKEDTNGDSGKNGTLEEDADREAMNAMLGESTGSSKPRALVIHSESNAYNEDDAFQRDFRNAPDESTLEDYEAIPVEEFGMAMLRGMGWDGKDRGAKVKQVKRRPNQLGLGAKELKADEDLGAWNQKGGSKSRPRLHDYKSEEKKRKDRRDDRHRDSYKQERDREREAERNGYRHRDRHYQR